MGICLDTEQNHDHDEQSTGGEQTRGGSGAWNARGRTPRTAVFPMQNTSQVKFEPPTVPVIFVLGGPGSGKVTHCDNLMQERRGVVHINMTDLLQQYAIGNDMQDFGTLSSKTVTEVLMLEMKMAPAAKTYLVSGYPRSMRDVAEYSDKVQTLSGVILVSWRQRVLERQIEYGARLGHVVLALARMELANFYKRVMPVADYFDQTHQLIAVNGERNPEEVYKDFRAAVLQILGGGEDSLGGGAGGIPGEIVGVEPAPTDGDKPAPLIQPPLISMPGSLSDPLRVEPPPPPPSQPPDLTTETINVLPKDVPRGARTRAPAVLWVVGGPGSNKAALCQRAVALRPGWTHFSMGQRLRQLAEAGGAARSDGGVARGAVTGGELAPAPLVARLARTAVDGAADGLLLDGYPRDLTQMENFQSDYSVEPRMVLLDCSKLQLGRGRRDDAVAAFRRRLELFRENTLPLLKTLDAQHRLVIVDGDTDSPEVQEEFTRVLLEEMEKAEAISAMPPAPPPPRHDMTSMQQFAHAMSRMGGSLVSNPRGHPPPHPPPPGHPAHPPGVPGSPPPRANGALPNGNLANGFVAHNNKIKPLTNNPNKIPTVSEITQEEVRRLYAQSTGDIGDNLHI